MMNRAKMFRYSTWLAASLLLTSCAGKSGSTQPTLTPPPDTGATTAQAGAQAAQTRTPAPTPPSLRLPRAATPVEYRVDLTIDRNQAGFSGVVDMDIDLHEPTDHVWVSSTDLTVTRATMTMGGATWPIERLATSNSDFLGFALGKQVAPGSALLHIEYTGMISEKDYHGIFRQQEGEEWYVFTQLEAISARRVFPCFDEPHFKVPWQLTLTVPDGDLAVTNTPLVSQEARSTAGQEARSAAGMTTYRFAKSKPIPSYLIALAVGPFDVVDLGTIGRASTPARILTPRGRAAEAAHAAKIMPTLLEHLEDYFDMPYPYEKLDSVALPHFFGAMENPGLVTYSSGILLSDKVTPSFERRCAGIIAHEIAHQWFGNLVTLGWWDDIWLNESFATWMADKVIHKWKPEWKTEVYDLGELESSMSADTMDSARQIRQPIRSSEDIERAFDAISYGKGGAVLGMFERWIGEDSFRSGVRQYMQKHAWGAATSDDFLASIGAVSRPEVPSAFRTFLEQKGVPLVSVELSCRKHQKPALALTQERLLPTGSTGSTTQLWHVPLCVKYGNGNKVGEQCLLLTEKSATMTLDGASKCPDWVLANADAAGYYRVAYADGMISKLLTSKRVPLAVPERLFVVGDLQALVTSGKISAGEALSIVPTLLKDGDAHLSRRAARIAGEVSHSLVPDQLRPNYQRFVRKLFGERARKLGWQPKANEPDEVRGMREALLELVIEQGRDPVLIAEASKLASTWLETRKGIDDELLDEVLGTALSHGDRELYERFMQALDTSKKQSERRAILAALGATRDPANLARNFELAFSGKFGMRESGPLFQRSLSMPGTRQIAYDYIKSNYDQIVAKLPRMAAGLLVYSASGFCDEAHYQDADAFFRSKLESQGGGTKALDATLERIKLCIAFRDAQQPSVQNFLRKY